MISFSVVVNTHNRAELLADTLQGLAGLRYPRFEIVVVNGPSTDGTAALLAVWADRVKLLECPAPNLALSRNLGIAAAAGDVVAFIDDDAVPHPDWLTELSYAYADPRIGGAGGFTLDHTGVRFQARKQVSDRYGNAFERPDDYDERVLTRPGAPLYPALLGTNSSFRRTALMAVGGFDPLYAYFLDETDLCLRLADAGWRVVYASGALVFHQFAPSAMRDARRVPRSIYRLVVSKTYFILRHGTAADMAEAGRQLSEYEEKMRADNARLLTDLAIGAAHQQALDQDLQRGLADGRAAAFAGKIPGWLDADAQASAFKAFSAHMPSLAVITRTPTPWLEQWLAFLAARGWMLHLLCEGELASSCFHGNIWRHVRPCTADGAALAAERDVPLGVAAWCATVAEEYNEIKSFGIDLAATTLRALPGLALLDQMQVLLRDGSTEQDLAANPQWRERPLFAHFHCARLIAQEQQALAQIATQAVPGEDMAECETHLRRKVTNAPGI